MFPLYSSCLADYEDDDLDQSIGEIVKLKSARKSDSGTAKSKSQARPSPINQSVTTATEKTTVQRKQTRKSTSNTPAKPSIPVSTQNIVLKR